MNRRSRWKTRLCQQFDVDRGMLHANHGNRCHLLSTATNGPARANLPKHPATVRWPYSNYLQHGSSTGQTEDPLN
jgi:hypothetical protein